MASPHEQLSPELEEAAADPFAQPNGDLALTLAEPPVNGVRLGTPGESREERQATGYEAYNQATKRRVANNKEKEEGEPDELDAETVRLYKKADNDLLAADVWMGSGDRPRNPFNMLTRAACLGWQAEAMNNGVFYDSPYSHIDMKSRLQELAKEELEGANEILLGNNPVVEELAGKMKEMDTAVIAEAAAGAAKEAGTDEHVVVRGFGKVDKGTPERLEAEGRDGIERFVGLHAMEAAHGGRFTAIMAEKEVTEVHSLPVAA